MSRYIDADALKESIKKYISFGNGAWGVEDSVFSEIDEQPTADVVEMAKCESCKYSEYCTKVIRIHGIEKAVNYCSYGERREDGEIH